MKIKSFAEIKEEIKIIEDRIIYYEYQYRHLSQIDMQSGDGVHIQKEINQAKGKKEALIWVIS